MSKAYLAHLRLIDSHIHYKTVDTGIDIWFFGAYPYHYYREYTKTYSGHCPRGWSWYWKFDGAHPGMPKHTAAVEMDPHMAAGTRIFIINAHSHPDRSNEN